MDGGNIFLKLLNDFAPEGLPTWVIVLTSCIAGVSVLIGFVSVLAMVATWAERKVAGHIQCRYGPMYVGGWHGWAQPIADGLKLIMKEDMIPLGADRPLFILAPAVVLGAMFGALVSMPFAPDVYFANVDLGLFLILALSSLTTIGVIMAGWASNSKWALYGAMREAAQVVAYEIPLGISLLVPLLLAGTFNLVEASEAQSGWYGMHWFVFSNPFVIPALVIFGIAALAETKRAPFDLPEAESELVSGFLTEYSGIRWSLFFMEEYAAMFLMSVVGAVFFLGGFESPITHFAGEWAGTDSIIYNLAGHVTLMTKAAGGVFMMMWLRWTLPRVRIDQVMTMGYKYLTPIALVCVLGACLFEGLWAAIF